MPFVATNVHKDVPFNDWIVKQTLTTAERYITPGVKSLRRKILGAEDKIAVLEQTLYEALVRDLIDYIISFN